MLSKLSNIESIAIISLLTFEICRLNDNCERLADKCVSKDNVLAEKDITIAKLEAEIAQKHHPKNSSNSSLPPSFDFSKPKRNQTLRKISNKLPGAQKGHIGCTLQLKEHPDKVVKYSPCICSECGMNLTDFPEQLIDKRQVIDLPPIQPIYAEHRIYKKICNCGHVIVGLFPKEINAPIQYGSSVEVETVYLHSRQYLPYKRLAEFFKFTLNLPISPGTLNNIVHRFAQKGTAAYNAIKEAIKEARMF